MAIIIFFSSVFKNIHVVWEPEAPLCGFFICRRKLNTNRLADSLRAVTKWLALKQIKNQIPRSRRRRAHKVKVSDSASRLFLS